MAQIEPRVTLILNVLERSGFGWLAAEIITFIEAGSTHASSRDLNVRAHRKSMIGGSAIPQQSYFAAISDAGARQEYGLSPLSGTEQIHVAVDLLVDRLSASLEMTEKGVETLGAIFDQAVKFSVNIDNEVRAVDIDTIRRRRAELESMRGALKEWLLAQTPDSET